MADTFRVCHFQAVKKLFFDSLAEVKGAPKTSKPDSSAYIGTIESGLRSKAKCLAQQAFSLPTVYRKAVYAVFVKEMRYPKPSKNHFDGLGLF